MSGKRSLDQNKIFHCFCAEISDYLTANNARCSPAMVKELVKMLLGNTSVFMSTKIAMPTSSYRRSDEDLTEQEMKAGIISFDELLNKTIVWAATDLNLELKSINEIAA